MKPQKPAFTQRIVILPADLEKIRGYSPRGARNFILKLKKKLGKDPKSFIFIHELCEALHTSEEKIRGYMRMPILYFTYIFGMIYLFRNDMDLWLIWVINLLFLQGEYLWFRNLAKKIRLFLVQPDLR